MISRGFFVPGRRSFARTGMPRFVRDGEPDARRLSRCACSACATCSVWPQALVLDDGSLVDFRELVVAATAQGDAVGPDLDAPVRILPHLEVTADPPAVRLGVVEKIDDTVVLQRQ